MVRRGLTVEPCKHGPGSHDGAVDSRETAPTAYAWLLIEHPGPWAANALDTPSLPAIAHAAADLGIRVQLIHRPWSPAAEHMYFAWTADPAPWMIRIDVRDAADLPRFARGERPSSGQFAAEPMYLVCAHGSRDACCGRLGDQLARVLAAREYPVWETTHLGGHRFAPNLVILPEGLYYGPVSPDGAAAAIEAHQAGAIATRGFRGRSGAPVRSATRVR